LIRKVVSRRRRVDASNPSADHATIPKVFPQPIDGKPVVDGVHYVTSSKLFAHVLISESARQDTESSILSCPGVLSPTHTLFRYSLGPSSHTHHRSHSLQVLEQCDSLPGPAHLQSQPSCYSRPTLLYRAQAVDRTTACGSQIARQRG
jgi:hypothetical protein